MIKVNDNIKVDGVLMPQPSSIKVSRNKLWSTGSGRTMNGTYQGNLVALKWRLDLGWTLIDAEIVKKITSAFEPAFERIEFINPKTNKPITCTFYAGDMNFNVKSYALKGREYSDITLSIVEK